MYTFRLYQWWCRYCDWLRFWWSIVEVPAGKGIQHEWSFNGTPCQAKQSLTLATFRGLRLPVTSTNGMYKSGSTFLPIRLFLHSVSPTDTLYCVYNNPVNLAAPSVLGIFHRRWNELCNIWSPAAAGIGTHVITYKYHTFTRVVTWSKSDSKSGCMFGELLITPGWKQFLYPNPNSGSFTLGISSWSWQGSVEFVNTFGQTVYSWNNFVTKGMSGNAVILNFPTVFTLVRSTTEFQVSPAHLLSGNNLSWKIVVTGIMILIMISWGAVCGLPTTICCLFTAFSFEYSSYHSYICQ